MIEPRKRDVAGADSLPGEAGNTGALPTVARIGPAGVTEHGKLARVGQEPGRSTRLREYGMGHLMTVQGHRGLPHRDGGIEERGDGSGKRRAERSEPRRASGSRSTP